MGATAWAATARTVGTPGWVHVRTMKCVICFHACDGSAVHTGGENSR
jgi:hypothetical protein